MSQIVIMSYDFDPRMRVHRRALLLLFSSSSHVRIFASPWTVAQQAPLSSTISLRLLKFMSIESVMLSNHLILCTPFSFCLLSFLGSGSSPESALHIRWPEYWSCSISPSNEYSGLISLGLTGLILLQFKELSRVFSSTTIQKHQFFGTQPSFGSNSHICI